MQTANILVAIGGDKGNTVPKYDVTPSEIALLRAIHGDEAVSDIEPLRAKKLTLDGDPITPRGELNRLRALYGNAKDGENNSHFDLLFPGAAARAFETIAELDLPDIFFKASGRVAQSVEAAPAPKVAARGKKAKAEVEEVLDEAAAEEIDEAGDAEIGDMPDAAPPPRGKAAGSNLFT